MFSYNVVHSETVVISDPGADGTFLIWKSPSRPVAGEILSAWAACDTAISGVGTVIVLRLYDMGTAGTAIGGTISATLGAAGTGDWTANAQRAFTISEGTISASHFIGLSYDETGTIAPKNITVGFEWVGGIGA